MTADVPTILATSAGFRPAGHSPYDWRPGRIHEYAAELSGAGDTARICFLHQAVGDHPVYVASTYAAFAGTGYRVSHVALFPMPNVADLRAHLLAQDVIWVGGGSVANLVAVWRVHGLDEVLHEAWQAGVVLGGVSAGSICWHVGGTTDSFGRDLRPFTAGLGWLPYANGVHYDSEEQRRPLLHRLVGDGTLPGAYATDDGAGLLYRGTELVEVVADRPGPRGYAVELDGGSVRERELPTRLLS